MCGTDRSGDATSGTGEVVSKDEVLGFSTNCSNCNAPAETRMKLLGILLKLAVPSSACCDNSAHSQHVLELDAYMYVAV